MPHKGVRVRPPPGAQRQHRRTTPKEPHDNNRRRNRRQHTRITRLLRHHHQHRKTLATEKDYNEAADGTIAASPNGMPFLKQHSVWRYLNVAKRDDEMANAKPRVMLRDGWNG